VRDVLLPGVAGAALLGTPEVRAQQNSGAIDVPGATVSSVRVKPGDSLKAAMP
jgi:hypothetical protein